MANMRYDGGDNGNGAEILSCSFCGKSEYDVPRLFSGVNCYICIDCIRTAYGIISEEEKVRKKKRLKSTRPNKLITPHDIKDKLDQNVEFVSADNGGTLKNGVYSGVFTNKKTGGKVDFKLKQ